jgi:hypothetical protein
MFWLLDELRAASGIRFYARISLPVLSIFLQNWLKNSTILAQLNAYLISTVYEYTGGYI